MLHNVLLNSLTEHCHGFRNQKDTRYHEFIHIHNTVKSRYHELEETTRNIE